MVVLVLRLLVQRPPGFIAFNQPTLGQVLHPKVSLTRRCLVVRKNRSGHLDRAVAQRVLHSKTAVAMLLTMSLHRLRRNRLHHKDDVLVRWFHPSVVFVAYGLTGGGTIGVFPNQSPADDEANLFKERCQFVRSPRRSKRHHIATGLQNAEAFPPDSETGNAVIPLEIAEVDAIRGIADNRRNAVSEDGFQHLCAVPAFQDGGGARGVLERQFGGEGREVGRGVHARSFCVWTGQVGADFSTSSDSDPAD